MTAKNPRCPLEPGSIDCMLVMWPPFVLNAGNPCTGELETGRKVGPGCEWWEAQCRCDKCGELECICED